MSGERGPIEYRSGGPVATVDYPERILTMIVAPYDEWAVVEHQGAFVEESFAPGAFGAIRNRARKFKVNMEHDELRWVGTVIDLDDCDAGLRATVQMRRRPEALEALDDAADGLLGASIGMAVAPGDGPVVAGKRRIRKAYLDHIALTATPAYVGAEILEVRAAPTVIPASPSATPNLDRILAERAEMRYRSLLT